MLAAAGVRLRLIAVTDGEASHPDADPAVIAQTRAAESGGRSRPARAPRSAEVVRLRLPDTGLAAREDELAAALRELCAGFDVCLAPWEEDAHADHEAAGRAAAGRPGGGRTVLSYPIWMWHWAQPGRPARALAPRLPGTAAAAGIAARKRAAIAAFASQLTGRGPGLGPVLPPGIVAHFTREQEVLLR